MCHATAHELIYCSWLGLVPTAAKCLCLSPPLAASQSPLRALEEDEEDEDSDHDPEDDPEDVEALCDFPATPA